MKTKFLTVLLILTSLFSFSQQLTYKSGGKIIDMNNNKMAPDEVRELLSSKPNLLELYNAGRIKKTVGNILLFSGLGLVVADLANGLLNDVDYPTPLTYIGISCFVISIPIKIGYSKKIKTVVEDYNKQLVINETDQKIETVSFITNSNGLGIQVTF